MSQDKRVRQAANRDRERRRLEALEETRRDRERLEARIARETQQPNVGPAPGATYVMTQETRDVLTDLAATTPGFPGLPEQRAPQPRRGPSLGRLPAHDAEGEKYPLGQARNMVRAGYHVCQVMWLTGWGLKWLDDLPLDEDGYGLPL